MNKPAILFICTHNSARSQMAEGYLTAMYNDRYTAYSAGAEVTKVHPLAIEVMKEVGVDISGHRSKSLQEFIDGDIDAVVMVCDGAKAACPLFSGAKRTIHQEFSDPTSVTGTDQEKIAAFRRIRDEIIRWIDESVGPGGFLDFPISES